MRQHQARNRAGHTHRHKSTMLHVVALTVIADIHAFSRRQRCFLAEIEGRRVAIGAVIDHEATTTNIACCRPGDGQCKCRSNGSIDGIAALLENINAYF